MIAIKCQNNTFLSTSVTKGKDDNNVQEKRNMPDKIESFGM